MTFLRDMIGLYWQPRTQARGVHSWHFNHRSQSHFDGIDKSGTLRVVRQPPFDSLAVGIGGRLRALADGL